MTTIRAVLFGDLIPAQSGATVQKIEEAAERLAGAGAVPQRAETSPVAMARVVLTKVADVLNVPVSDVLVGAWRTRSTLLEAARESLKQPGTVRQVAVTSYAFPWDYSMDVDVTLNGVAIATVSVTTTVELSVLTLNAFVQNGRITRISSGDIVIATGLHLTGSTAVPVEVPLAHGERKLPLIYEVPLPADGLSLVDQPATFRG